MKTVINSNLLRNGITHMSKYSIALLLATFCVVIPNVEAAASQYHCKVAHIYFDNEGVLIELTERPGNNAEFFIDRQSGKLTGYVSSENKHIKSYPVYNGVYFVYERKGLLGRVVLDTFHIRGGKVKGTHHFQFNRDSTIYTGKCALKNTETQS